MAPCPRADVLPMAGRRGRTVDRTELDGSAARTGTDTHRHTHTQTHTHALVGAEPRTTRRAVPRATGCRSGGPERPRPVMRPIDGAEHAAPADVGATGSSAADARRGAEPGGTTTAAAAAVPSAAAAPPGNGQAERESAGPLVPPRRVKVYRIAAGAGAWEEHGVGLASFHPARGADEPDGQPAAPAMLVVRSEVDGRVILKERVLPTVRAASHGRPPAVVPLAHGRVAG